MARVKAVNRKSDLPAGSPLAGELDELFAYLAPGEADPEIGAGKAPWGLLSISSPRSVLNLLKLGYHLQEVPWTTRADLREIGLHAANMHYQSSFAFEAHLPYAEPAGLTIAQLAAIPYWRTSSLFDDEQRVVIEYTLAVLVAGVTDELFSRVVKAFGEPGAVGLTAAVGFWAYWAMFNSALQPNSPGQLPSFKSA